MNSFWTSIILHLEVDDFLVGVALFRVYVLLICSYLLITGCKIVQIKANTFGRSNDNSSKYYINCQPTLQRA